MATKVSKNLITSVDPSQLTTTGATAGQVLTYNASTTTWVASAAPGSAGGSISSGTAVTLTNQTSVDFTGIPSTAKRITVMFSGVSNSDGNTIVVQIGSGSIDSSGYSSSVGGITSTTSYAAGGTPAGFGIAGTMGASSLVSGVFTICLLTSNTYVGFGAISRSSENNSGFSAGSKTLTGTLDRVRFTMANGTATFDAGTVNIMWE